MTYHEFYVMLGEAAEETSEDRFVMDRGWQGWMEPIGAERAAAVMRGIYAIAHAQNVVREVIGVSGMTQVDFSKNYRISRRSIGDWYTGKRAAPEYLVWMLSFAVISDMLVPVEEDDE